MLKQPNLTDDLFERSSMSFGEHLDELRQALVKAFIWLGIGTGIGLYFANHVVNFVKEPMREQLDVFYLEQTKAKFKSITGTDAPPQLIEWMQKYSVMPERVFLVPLPEPKTGRATSGDEKTGDEKTGDGNSSAKLDSPSVLSETDVWKMLATISIDQLRPTIHLKQIPNRLLTFDSIEAFLILLKAGLLLGALIASPGIFYHIWAFLAAGLYPHERKYVYMYLPLSVLLFVGGVALAFFVIFKLVIGFLLTYNLGLDVDMAPRLKDYISLVLLLPLGFGVAFQLPIVMLGLNRAGIVSLETYTSKWRIAVLAIAFLSMVLTPADPYSMMGMFIPLTLLYFLGIALCRFMPKGRGLGSQAFDPT